ncbi:BCCT family transporter [Sphingomonas jatrophae]|uniref:BCCT family transporter n=1 Tax=Sphingomonas jatrophae TaxID=1166337 RepID=UPI001F614CA0|nr:BCCT family transporter [Sphingomonas jatrophae]
MRCRRTFRPRCSSSCPTCPVRASPTALAVLLVAVFFITSADSGALVIDTLASGGAEETPRWQRMYWCILLGVTAALLLLAGGLGALQAATLLAALPFCFIMLLLAYGLVRQTGADLAGVPIEEDPETAIGERLRRLFRPTARGDVLRQIADRGVPALHSVRAELEAQGFATSRVTGTADEAALTVEIAPERHFTYRLMARSRPLAAYTALEAPEARRSLTWSMVARSDAEPRARDLTGQTEAQIATDVLTQLERWRDTSAGLR